MALTDKQQRFVEEYLLDLNATQAAIRAGYSEDTAQQQGYQLLQKTSVHDAIAEAMAARSEHVQIIADEVLRELKDIATTDANELVEHRIGCCRFCWGRDFRYQRTRNELECAEALHAAETEKAIREGRKTTLFDPEGGAGYHARREPNPDCSEWFGDGVGRPVFNKYVTGDVITRLESRIDAMVASVREEMKDTREAMLRAFSGR